MGVNIDILPQCVKIRGTLEAFIHAVYPDTSKKYTVFTSSKVFLGTAIN